MTHARQHLASQHYEREKVIDRSALSPQKTRRIHALQFNTPNGGCAFSTYAADTTPAAGEDKAARTRRLVTTRERRVARLTRRSR